VHTRPARQDDRRIIKWRNVIERQLPAQGFSAPMANRARLTKKTSFS
jgi:hypothetical protein